MIDDRPLTSFALAMIYCLICVLLLTAPSWAPMIDAIGEPEVKLECPK